MLSEQYQYVTSLHWAMAQMTLGSIEIVSASTVERLVTISMMLIGLLVSSALVSSLSAAMVSFQMRRTEQNETMRILRQYLRQNKVDSSLSLCVFGSRWKNVCKIAPS